MLLARGLSKRFGATVALDAVSLELRAGEVRAILGENGAGKSTLLRILAGAERADSGALALAGDAYAPRSPADARRAGVAMVHQELSIAPDLSVEANVMLGREVARAGLVDAREHARRARAALTRLGHGDLVLDRRAGELPIAAQQIVEIARALEAEADVLILDEPTSSLGRTDAERLFAIVRELARAGIAVAYVSHFLDEVRHVADAFTVLRDGRVVDEGDISAADDARLVASMAGAELAIVERAARPARGEPLLEIEGLAGVRAPRGVDLAVHRGEIVGLAGLVGAGRSELLRVVYGLDRRAGGRALVRGRGTIASAPRESLARGVGFVSEDRKREGLALDLALDENVTLSRLAPLARGGVLDLAARRDRARALLERVGCRMRDPSQAARELSGGNQQKAVVARLLHEESDVWLLDEPTRGIDVGAKARVHALVAEHASRGGAVLLASSDVDELLHVCDRIAVMRRGELVATKPASAWTREDLVARMSAASGEAA